MIIIKTFHLPIIRSISSAQMLEEFSWKSIDLFLKLDRLKEILMGSDLPDDLTGAKCAIEEHNVLKRKIMKAPIDSVDAEGQRILDRIYDRGTGRRNQNPS